MAASLVGTLAGIIHLHDVLRPAWGLSEAQAVKLAMTAFLGISLLFSLALVGERGRSGWNRNLLQAAGALLLLAYYLSIDEKLKDDSWLRFWMHFAAAHLLVSFAPFLRDRQPRAFWQYNQVLSVRIITAMIISCILVVSGLVFLVMLSGVLGLEIPIDSAWGGLLFLIYGVFNTWFFLAGVPRDFDSMERKDSYPRQLTFLSRYVLIPLVSLNVIIQYACVIAILVDVGRGGDWPKTRIDVFFLAVGLCGILSLLLLYPVREEKDKPWVKVFRQWFYPSQWPLQIFLVVVLAHQVFRLGLEEDTYLSLVLALWIAGMAAYFTLGKGKSIKAIPITLFLLCMLCSFGPWGIIDLPAKDQVRHLEKVMAANGLLQDGRYASAKPGRSLPEKDRERIRDILIYLDRHGDLEILRHRLSPDTIDSIVLSHFSQLARYLRIDE